MKIRVQDVVCVAAILFGLTAVSSGDTLQVPLDYPTIFSAINASEDGDTILVSPGTYPELPLDFLGKAITVQSTGGPYVTIIEGNGFSVVSFMHGEGADSVLDGFSITNGSRKSWGGGGIYCRQASPTIKNNVIGGNTALMGGGLYCEYASPIIENNLFFENSAVYGGGLYCGWSSHPEISGNTFLSNTAVNMDKKDFNGGGGIFCVYNSYPIITGNKFLGNVGDFGGALCCHFGSFPLVVNNIMATNTADYGAGICSLLSFPTITNNTITMNSAGQVGGGMLLYRSNPTITNTILWDNQADTWSGHPRYNEIYFHSVPGGPNVNYCVVKNGWTTGEGNLDADPLFVSPGTGNFHLQSGSPCIDMGTNSAPGIPDTDFEGDDRIIDGDGNAVAVVDMGADEYL